MDHLLTLRANLFVTLGFSKWHCSANNLYYMFLQEQHEHDDDGVAEGLNNATLYRLWVYKMDEEGIFHEYRDNDVFILYEKDNKLLMRVDNMEFPIEDTLNRVDSFILRDRNIGDVTFTKAD